MLVDSLPISALLPDEKIQRRQDHAPLGAALLLIYYHVPEYWRKAEKLEFLKDKENIRCIDWIELHPDENYTWITEGLHSEFSTFLSLGTKEAKSPQNKDSQAIFRMYSGGVKTNRDTWAYDFNCFSLEAKLKIFIETYNSDVDRWRRRGQNPTSVDDFVTYDDKRIKWSGDLKQHLEKGKYALYSEQNIRQNLYRPFIKQYLYFDPLLNNRRYLQHLFFPGSGGGERIDSIKVEIYNILSFAQSQ